MLNRIVLMGRFTKDPELQHTPSDVSVCRFTIACDRSYAKQGEEKKTDFIEIVAWRNTAEFICRYFGKGRMAAIEGELHVDNYTDKEGNKRTRVYVNASDVYFADSVRDAGKPEKSAQIDQGTEDDFSEIEADGDLPF